MRLGMLEETGGFMAETEMFGSEQSQRLLLDQIADKWSILILAALCKGPLRFNALKRRLQGVTQKSLTQSLRRLERNGIVARRVIPVAPVAVEYRITELGRTLQHPFEVLHTWAVDHVAQVEEARKRFDEGVLTASCSDLPRSD